MSRATVCVHFRAPLFSLGMHAPLTWQDQAPFQNLGRNYSLKSRQKLQPHNLCSHLEYCNADIEIHQASSPCPRCRVKMIRAVVGAALAAVAAGQPFQPGSGVGPLGSLRTSDYAGPYNISLLSTQVRTCAGVKSS